MDIRKDFQRLAETPDNAELILIDISARVVEATKDHRGSALHSRLHDQF
jgi:hypothetical protein